MSKNIKQTIKVTANATYMLKLPCVYSCHKEANGHLCYLLYGWDTNGQYIEAHEGQWLCEDYDGKWTVRDAINGMIA